MRILRQTASSRLGITTDAYLYKLEALQDHASRPQHLAALSSDNSVRVFDASTLQLLSGDDNLQGVSKSVTSLTSYGSAGTGNKSVILTAGRDGLIRGWDVKTYAKVLEFQAPREQPLSALACNDSLHAVVAGMELEGNPPGEVIIFGWDVRKPNEVLLKYADSHTDTVTELLFAPESSKLPSNYLLSASTDGLVTIYDSALTDEDDAVLQVINHRSAVQHAGFVRDDIFALGTDETLSFYNKPGKTEDAQDVRLGDVRERLGCDYVADVICVGSHSVIASGSHGDEQSRQYLDLIPLEAPTSGGSLDWTPNVDNKARLVGGHGSEVIRHLLAYDDPCCIYTCGEDGMVRVWHESKDTGSDVVISKKRRNVSDEKNKGKRSKSSQHG